MHFEILVEDQSGKKALDILIPKIISNQHKFKVRPYQGIGHIPKNLTNPTNANTNLLLNQLPMQLRAYGKNYANDPTKVVIVVCDLDNNCLRTFRRQLFTVLNACNPRPKTRFCIAIEEGEAWLLGDIPAIKAAYPRAKDNILNGYQNDSICGTWELLADAVFRGGSSRLKKRGWQTVGREKSTWAQKITPYMNVDQNASPSFCYFRDKIRELI
ncbi:MAG: DUF4276 family protein [Candidatus Poribacteria bacterium]|nr:DUF4276 family protein [Candidatus Poribacteria bacterium]MDD9975001.1 DUF4276 family protein [Candidatus Poribacteria bacterium]MDE0322717.1 DUF4276 family protein [Candidatus Poribacteria bacterium]